DELGVEVAAALIGRKSLVSVGLRVERIPADQHRARPLGAIELQQAISETENRAAGRPPFAEDRLRQRSDFFPLCFSLKSDNFFTMASCSASIRKAVRKSLPCISLMRL